MDGGHDFDGSPATDAGAAADGDLAADGATADSGLPLGCAPALSPANTVSLSGATLPFTATRAYAHWDAVSCDPPSLWIGLSAGGCVAGAEDELRISLSASSIGSTVVIGANPILPEPLDEGIRVRLSAPGDDGTLRLWGSCAGATGLLTFESLEARAGGRIAASIDLSLTDCAEPAAVPAVTVTGHIDVTLAGDHAAVCL